MSTQRFELTSTRWTGLGPTPGLFQNRSRGAVAYALGQAEPASLDAPAHMLSPSGTASLVTITHTNQRFYARSMWGEVSAVAFTPSTSGAERVTVIANFVATTLAPLTAGKLTQTLSAPGLVPGDILVASVRTALPQGIILTGEVTVPAAGKVAISFLVPQALTALAATPVAIDLTPIR